MPDDLKKRILRVLSKARLLAAQSVPFGHQKADPTLTEMDSLIQFLERMPDDPTSDPRIVTFSP